MDKTRSLKVYRALLHNPFPILWNEISREQTLELVNALLKEFQQNASPSIRIEVKRQKIDNLNMLSFGKNQLVLGVNKIADNIGNVDCVVLLKSELNESLIEPLLLLCKTRGVKVITASYELSIEKLRDITGVKRLAAFAFPKNHCFTLTRYIIDQFMPKSLSKK